MSFECAARTHVGLRRKINEDCVFADAERGLWAVADGMGGHSAGEIASAMVIDALHCLSPAPDVDRLAAQAIEALREVNGELVELARSNDRNGDSTIGTTVVGLAIGNGSFRCFWMGDSRAYRLRRGEIKRLTHDHSLVQNLVDAGLLKAEEADNHPDANLITRAVGVGKKFEMDLVSGDVQPGDQFLLASDGLTRLVPDCELAAELDQRKAGDVADRLVEMVLERGAPDNVSIIIIRSL